MVIPSEKQLAVSNTDFLKACAKYVQLQAPRRRKISNGGKVSLSLRRKPRSVSVHRNVRVVPTPDRRELRATKNIKHRSSRGHRKMAERKSSGNAASINASLSPSPSPSPQPSLQALKRKLLPADAMAWGQWGKDSFSNPEKGALREEPHGSWPQDERSMSKEGLALLPLSISPQGILRLPKLQREALGSLQRVGDNGHTLVHDHRDGKRSSNSPEAMMSSLHSSMNSTIVIAENGKSMYQFAMRVRRWT